MDYIYAKFNKPCGNNALSRLNDADQHGQRRSTPNCGNAGQYRQPRFRTPSPGALTVPIPTDSCQSVGQPVANPLYVACSTSSPRPNVTDPSIRCPPWYTPWVNTGWSIMTKPTRTDSRPRPPPVDTRHCSTFGQMCTRGTFWLNYTKPYRIGWYPLSILS